MQKIIIKESNIQVAYTKLLEECHHILAHNKSVSDGNWNKCQDFCFWDYDVQELFDKSILIVASENDFKYSSAISKSLGMDVTPYSDKPPAAPYSEDIILIHSEGC